MRKRRMIMLKDLAGTFGVILIVVGFLLLALLLVAVVVLGPGFLLMWLAMKMGFTGGWLWLLLLPWPLGWGIAGLCTAVKGLKEMVGELREEGCRL
jgi:hypothetical protein